MKSFCWGLGCEDGLEVLLGLFELVLEIGDEGFSFLKLLGKVCLSFVVELLGRGEESVGRFQLQGVESKVVIEGEEGLATFDFIACRNPDVRYSSVEFGGDDDFWEMEGSDF